MDKVPMTAEGYAVLEAEIKHLKTVERPRIIKLIADARTHGEGSFSRFISGGTPSLTPNVAMPTAASRRSSQSSSAR